MKVVMFLLPWGLIALGIVGALGVLSARTGMLIFAGYVIFFILAGVLIGQFYDISDPAHPRRRR